MRGTSSGSNFKRLMETIAKIFIRGQLKVFLQRSYSLFIFGKRRVEIFLSFGAQHTNKLAMPAFDLMAEHFIATYFIMTT